MLLAVDIGNTNIVLGVFDDSQLIHSWRVSTRRDQTSDEYAVLCKNLFDLSGVEIDAIDAVIICSVVPPLNDCFLGLSRRYFNVDPIFVEADQQNLMPILYHPASDVGADRIVNSIAAWKQYGVPIVVVDFGTAATFDVVSASAEYVGGIIAPGIGLSADALFQRAAKLPRIEIHEPSEVVGRSTVASMQSGLFYGYVGLVEGILGRIEGEMGAATVVATGGYADMIGDAFSGFDHIEPDLTIQGLRICFEHLRT